MNRNTNLRKNFLDKANGATSLLALLVILAVIPGGIRLYRFALDARDQVIETTNLTGLGDFTVPGINFSVAEPYASLALYCIAVIVPLWVFISLLVKKSKIRKDRVPGSGSYWFIILAGIFVIFTALGFLSMLINGRPGGIANINKDPLNLAVCAGALIAVIAAIYAISSLGKARRISKTESGDYVEGPLHSPEKEGPGNSLDITQVPYDRSFIEEQIRLSQEPQDEETALDAAPAGELTSSDGPVSEGYQYTGATQVSEEKTGNALPVSDTSGFEKADALNSAEEQPDRFLNEENSGIESPVIPAMETAPSSTTCVKRRFLSLPGDDSKVIVLFQEFEDGRMIQEWTEIHSRSEFKKSRR